MAEKSLWAYLRNGMRGKWEHVRRHEDILGEGIADVSYYHRGNSWIELKEVKKLPARESTGINMNFTKAQKHFLEKRKGWLLVRVNAPKRFYLLYEHNFLPPARKPYWCWEDMKAHAFYIWGNRIDFDMLAIVLGDPE